MGFWTEDIPYMGGGITVTVLTVLTRDKIVAKQVLAAHSIPMVPHFAFTREDYVEDSDKILPQASAFKLPLFVKPANLGSAIGDDGEGFIDPGGHYFRCDELR